MFFNAYMEKNNKPGEDSVEKTLGASYGYYREILRFSQDFEHKWVFSKADGWSMKIYDIKKALCYIYPSEGNFRVYMTLRENERNSLINNPNIRFAYKKLGESKQFSEGFAVTYDVKDEISAEKCSLFMKEVILLRLPAAKRKMRLEVGFD